MMISVSFYYKFIVEIYVGYTICSINPSLNNKKFIHDTQKIHSCVDG